MSPLYVEVLSPLYVEVHRWASLEFIWGETDCCLVCCDWVASQTGIDPADEIRMTYSNMGECQRVTGYLRDPLTISTRLMEEVAGLPRTSNPVAGDVGVIKVMQRGVVRAVGGLCLGEEGWATKSPDGTTTLSRWSVLGVMRAWSVGYAS